MIDSINLKEREVISKYFPSLKERQYAQFEELGVLYKYWNARINLISRKDIAYLYPRHILHSLALAKIISFAPETDILDLGTGGGLPGIPLAILFPDTQFYLVDSTEKKIKVVSHISKALGLKNVVPLAQRAETLKGEYDFILARAVSKIANLYKCAGDKIKPTSLHALPNGFFCWKGGDIKDEIAEVSMNHTIFSLQTYFDIDFFQNKYILHIYPS